MTGIIKVSRSIKELNMKISKLEEEYLRETGENISITEISKRLKIAKEEVAAAMEARNPVESIYREDGKSDDDKNLSLINKLPASENEENEIVNKITVSQLIEGLENKERQIILLRFYKNKTQTEVGKILRNITGTSF
jgi:RNA polymerase sporulation-specific sigma factor